MYYLKDFFHFLKSSVKDIIPIVIVIIIFQLLIIQKVPENWQATIFWLVVVVFWLSIFLMWLKHWIFPIWERLTKSFSWKSIFIIMAFWFLIWFSTSIAEPALYVISQKASEVSLWRINQDLLRIIVALSVGSAISLWIFAMIKKIPIYIFIIIWYFLVLGITYFTPKEIVWLAYDLWWVTTSTITVPLITAIWIWITNIFWKKWGFVWWFWLIACAALSPMIFVQIYGIYVYNFWDTVQITKQASEVVKQSYWLFSILSWLFEVIKWVIPIILTIWFFQYIILKEKIPHDELKELSLWFLMVIFGLYLFILWLEMWLFSLWESMAFQLTALQNNYLILLFAFLIWFATTMAEPTLIVVTQKASELSKWKINSLILRIFVAIWVWIWITIWTYRIINWDQIHYYIMIWYFLVILLTYFTPKDIVWVAYDSWWVTTSTITVPLVTALWIWLATNIAWRNPLTDGFWLIAFASLFPILSVLIYWLKIKLSSKHSLKELNYQIPILEEIEEERRKNLIQKVKTYVFKIIWK